ncbi:MAG TPA: DUF5916 domain-containing protein [Longimicrobiales bacterium]
MLPVAALHAQTPTGTAALAAVDTTKRVGVPSTPASSNAAHASGSPRAMAARLSGTVQVDGLLDEAIWQTPATVGQLHQLRPVEGAPPSQKTEVRVVYDDEAIYVGARMYDDQPAGIVGRLARRDSETGSDYILVQFDPYHNHNGDASFMLNPAGQRWDGGNGDVSWDPVWEGKAQRDSLGWTAEMRIPFSQLRFRPGSKEPWGFQIERYINRLNETNVFSFWPSNESGGPSRWGHIDGIASPSRVPGRLELLPYVVTQREVHGSVDADNPFLSKNEDLIRVGGDLKYQVTSTLTLSATINPDFGQAEVDPAVVNLSAFETFFDEKREFFIEGRDKFGFGSLWCFTCSNASSLSMLSTRRIGRVPQATALAFNRGEYVDVPDATTILGAAKLTGRTSKGWNIGMLDAVTAREKARVFDGTNQFEQEVEPATNYFVTRVNRELANGNLTVGGILTSVVRNFDDALLEQRLNRHAEGVGVNTEYWFKNRMYHFIGQAAMTNISGDPAAILRAQHSSARYFQRPDRDQGSNGLFTNAYDSTLTSMRGFGTYMRMAKEGGNWRWEASSNIRSPGFENNDIANLSRVDYMWFHGNINRRFTKPTKHYRYMNFTFGGQQQYNFEGDLNSSQVHANAYYESPFFWEFSLYTNYRPEVMDERRTRGGPVVGLASERYTEFFIATDRRKSVWFELFPSYGSTGEGGVTKFIGGSINLQPASNVSVSFGPRYSDSYQKAQYVREVTDPTATNFYGKRYVFADVDQRTLSMDTRVNVTFSPTMSLQLFAQPFISSNAFGAFKEYAQTRAAEKLVYGRHVGTVQEQLNAENRRTYIIDPDGTGPANSFEVTDPSFTFRSLRGNAVFRWEYVPGSTLFLVWTQDRASSEGVGEFDFSRDRRALFDSPANHVFLVKVNYWLPL